MDTKALPVLLPCVAWSHKTTPKASYVCGSKTLVFVKVESQSLAYNKSFQTVSSIWLLHFLKISFNVSATSFYSWDILLPIILSCLPSILWKCQLVHQGLHFSPRKVQLSVTTSATTVVAYLSPCLGAICDNWLYRLRSVKILRGLLWKASCFSMVFLSLYDVFSLKWAITHCHVSNIL